MPHSLKFLQKADLVARTGGKSNSEREKYLSLMSTLKGFEEYTLDRDGTIISTNLEAVTITGYEEWEVIGKHVSIFYSLEDQLAERAQSDLTKAEKKSPLILTGLRIKKKNFSFWAKVKIRPLLDDNVIVGYKMTLQDATHKAVSDHRVKGFRDEYLSLFNNSFVGIYKFNMSDYSVLMMNEKAEQLIGVIPPQARKLNFQDLFHHTDEFDCLITELKSNARVNEWEFKLKDQERWAMLTCRFFEEQNFVEGIIVDTTALRRSNSELERLNHELDQFIYHASHELRSPIVSMLGIINLVDLEESRETTLKLNSIMREKVLQLDDLLKNITSIAYNNKCPLDFECVEFTNVLKATLRELETSRFPIQVSYAITQDLLFYNDRARVQTIIKNVLSNAFNYYNPNEANSCINVAISVSNTEAIITISDNGIGIEQNYLDKIFKIFYKATEYPKGPGLGLYIVKVIVEKLEGRIHVESTVGQGSTFEIVIPNRTSMLTNN